MYHQCALDRPAFMERYHARSNVETTFSMIERKFGKNVTTKTFPGQRNEVLAKVLAHNVCCLIHALHELGIEPTFATS